MPDPALDLAHGEHRLRVHPALRDKTSGQGVKSGLDILFEWGELVSLEL